MLLLSLLVFISFLNVAFLVPNGSGVSFSGATAAGGAGTRVPGLSRFGVWVGLGSTGTMTFPSPKISVS